MGKRKKHSKTIGSNNNDIKLHIQEQAEENESLSNQSLDESTEKIQPMSEESSVENSIEHTANPNPENSLDPSSQDAIIDPSEILNLSNATNTYESEIDTKNMSETSSSDTTIDNANSLDIPTDESMEDSQNMTVADTTILKAKKRRTSLIKVFRIACMGGFVVFTALFLNEILLQPYLAAKASDKAKSLYQMPVMISPTITDSPKQEKVEDTTSKVERTDEGKIIVIPDPNRDEMGRLLSFAPLLEENPDVKGWIQLLNMNGENDTKIDYVVVQSDPSDPEYYLTRDWLGNKVKSGSLFLDLKSSVERNTKNLVIHGHNMTSTDDMFHYLLKYNEREFYDEHPIINFNTIYETGQWKVFSIFITNGAASEKEDLFDYTVSDFKSDDDFINFIYQLRIRSIYDIDAVDVNEDDQILTLSTCSYEVKNYRTVIVARKVREGEDITVDTSNVYKNPTPLYPYSFYYRYGGKAPKLPATFEEAYDQGLIYWYYKSEDGEEATDRPKREVIPEEEKAKEEKETKVDKETKKDKEEDSSKETSKKKDTKKDKKKDTAKDAAKDTSNKDSDAESKENTNSESSKEDSNESKSSSTDANQDKSQESPSPKVTPTTAPTDVVEADLEEDPNVNESKEPQEPLTVVE